jgi:hypothetical protein
MKRGRKTVGIYDRPKKGRRRNSTKIIAIVVTIAVLLMFLFARLLQGV